MHRARNTPPWASVLLSMAVILAPRAALATPFEGVLDQARQRLEKRDAAGAVDLLEDALARTTNAERAPLISLLEKAYDVAARQADAAGRRDAAESYRDNLAILKRLVAPATPAPTTPARSEPARTPAAPPVAPSDRPVAIEPARPAPESKDDSTLKRAAAPDTEPAPARPVSPLPPPRELPLGPAPTREPAEPPRAEPTAPTTDPPRPLPEIRPGPEAPAASEPPVTPAPTPVARPSTPPANPGPTVALGDAAFVARRYDEAGRIYAALDRGRKLPADRKDHWAYCRAVEVVRRINAKPTSAKEWTEIDAEIAQIRALSPTKWFGEYLRNRAAERNPGRSAGATPRRKGVTLRGSSPDEPPLVPAPTPAPRPNDGPVANLLAASPTPEPSATPWTGQPIVTENFQVLHAGEHQALAQQVADAAESARAAQLQRWGDPNRGLPWSPRCEILLFPSASEFSRVTGQPQDSPGFSTMGMSDGRISFRRVHLRIDHPNLVKAILPHEITHVVLADLFPHKQIPRWADEGIAVLAEPSTEQNTRAADLDEPLASGKLFKLDDLMTMDYPDARYWSLYYAQSVSLTRFLVELGGSPRFIQFVQASQQAGAAPALVRHYEIRDFADLQQRWLAYARSHASAVLTASGEPRDDPPPTRR